MLAWSSRSLLRPDAHTVVSLLVWLSVGAIVGLVLWNQALKTEAERRELWRQQKERGKPSFVWRYGALHWGTPVLFIFTAMCFLSLRSLPLVIIACNLLFCLYGGVVFGLRLWSRLEKRYQ